MTLKVLFDVLARCYCFAYLGVATEILFTHLKIQRAFMLLPGNHAMVLCHTRVQNHSDNCCKVQKRFQGVKLRGAGREHGTGSAAPWTMAMPPAHLRATWAFEAVCLLVFKHKCTHINLIRLPLMRHQCLIDSFPAKSPMYIVLSNIRILFAL